VEDLLLRDWQMDHAVVEQALMGGGNHLRAEELVEPDLERLWAFLLSL
jgi:hypothetical protein